ncbi:MAG: cytochrome D ubiquinol oxidase subunit II [Blastopirellula sp.]|nr:MAG: cytochrome D ubiquinol oxidase subunit II [Blastopirellula sp.]
MSLSESNSANPTNTDKNPRREREIGSLIQQIRDLADKLAIDDSSRGDLKILTRTLRELRYAFKVFSPYRSQHKVTMFGSARTLPDAPAYQQAEEFGRRIAEENWLVITGAASGIMEAGHLGAGKESSMGLNIMLPFEQGSNSIIEGDPKLVHMKYFFTRKLMFVKECEAVVCLPGGFGTLDEALEVLTLLQTGKRDMVPVVLMDAPGGTYWKQFHEYVINELLGPKMISPEDLALYLVTDNCDDALNEVTGFYEVYHSMRYVKKQLVLRLNEAPSDELLDAINQEFSDILVEGKFEVREALPEEDEPEMMDLARLVFYFNRRALGKLRMLINCLNARSIEPARRVFP